MSPVTYFTQLFTQTRRQAPADLERPGQQFLVRAGYIHPVAGGTPFLPPLGTRALNRMRKTFLEEIKALGGMEIHLPPSGERADLAHLPLLDFLSVHLRSHRQLPVLWFSLNQRPQETPQRGGGLLSARSQTVLEIISLHREESELERTSADLAGTLLGFLRGLSLPLVGGEDLPFAGLQTGQAWMIPLEIGEERLLICEECGYTAASSAARFARPEPVSDSPLPLKKVPTPECKTIADLAKFLGIPESQTAKAVFFTARREGKEELIFAVVRGDREVNEAAIRRATGAEALFPASEEAIRAAGAEPGYASPVGLKGVHVIVDTEIPGTPNLVAGANEAGYHLLNTVYGRDYTATQVAEIALAQPGYACPECREPLSETRGLTVARSIRFSSDFIRDRGLNYFDENGQSRPVWMEIHTLNLTRTFACLAELRHDNYGLILPPQASPFEVHLVVLPGKENGVASALPEVLKQLEQMNLDVLVDDRSESPGVKFNDADLIGVPVRLTLSERSLQQGGIEVRKRWESERQTIPLEDLSDWIRKSLSQRG
ncbi:proline--tRNA ligase [Anaerolinea thermophila]|uniref:Prolyl-tRNA synthetase n=1 Tax=Anaerolinea thermophila (strain DSM 14523 / JCM 11388 / NBRC 100420 / UNI-1) TaxID=926569 RepID=E8N367_ANATU|nr:YbaK/EbsC family protein [Anaerolinea thermophila]BAJ62881.1 putative prolyl-tRNA synthetase [Anaerolinea thermophila UNI-1]